MCRIAEMEIVGYIVQTFHEDKPLPDSGFKHLYKTYSHALEYAKSRMQDYLHQYYDVDDNRPYEIHTPSKKSVDQNGYAIVFDDSEIHIWIEVVVVE